MALHIVVDENEKNAKNDDDDPHDQPCPATVPFLR